MKRFSISLLILMVSLPVSAASQLENIQSFLASYADKPLKKAEQTFVNSALKFKTVTSEIHLIKDIKTAQNSLTFVVQQEVKGYRVNLDAANAELPETKKDLSSTITIQFLLGELKIDGRVNGVSFIAVGKDGNPSYAVANIAELNLRSVGNEQQLQIIERTANVSECLSGVLNEVETYEFCKSNSERILSKNADGKLKQVRSGSGFYLDANLKDIPGRVQGYTGQVYLAE